MIVCYYFFVTTIFSKIIKKEIPCFKIAEDENFFSFLDIRPIAPGHTLVIPKHEVDHFYEMSDENLSKILIFSKPIVKAIEKTIDCLRVGSLIAGLEVPHAHLHLVPIFSMQTFSFEFAKEASREELEQIQKQILAHL